MRDIQGPHYSNAESTNVFCVQCIQYTESI